MVADEADEGHVRSIIGGLRCDPGDAPHEIREHPVRELSSVGHAGRRDPAHVRAIAIALAPLAQQATLADTGFADDQSDPPEPGPDCFTEPREPCAAYGAPGERGPQTGP